MKRNYEALRYNMDNAILTSKQYLVYCYLMSISKWNYNKEERHYYIYKDEINISKFSKILNLNRTTIRTAIDKLIKEKYLQDCDKFYVMRYSRFYYPLDVNYLNFFI